MINEIMKPRGLVYVIKYRESFVHDSCKLYNTQLRLPGKLIDVSLFSNTVMWRIRAIITRLLGKHNGYLYGSSNYDLKVSGMAIGNGGHLIYHVISNSQVSTTNLPKLTGTYCIDSSNVVHISTKPSMPPINTDPNNPTFGYNNVVDDPNPPQNIVNYSLIRVENGIIPWNGQTGPGQIGDNDIGVDQPNTTLYSEIGRIPLLSSNGILYPDDHSVMFIADLGQSYFNNTNNWGYANFQANAISELGLICGDLNPNPNNDPGYGSTHLYTYKIPTSDYDDFKNIYGSVDKDVYTKPPTTNYTNPQPQDAFSSNSNKYSMIARVRSAAITKSSTFSLRFVWILTIP